KDCIRDGHVTGVQTCALPISSTSSPSSTHSLCSRGQKSAIQPAGGGVHLRLAGAIFTAAAALPRAYHPEFPASDKMRRRNLSHQAYVSCDVRRPCET